MFILGYVLIVTAKILHTILSLYQVVVIAAVILSWVRPAPSNEIIHTILTTINKLTEPLFFEIRKRLPRSFLSSGLDFTPLIVVMALYAIDMLLCGTLMEIGYRLRMGITASPTDVFQTL